MVCFVSASPSSFYPMDTLQESNQCLRPFHPSPLYWKLLSIHVISLIAVSQCFICALFCHWCFCVISIRREHNWVNCMTDFVGGHLIHATALLLGLFGAPWLLFLLVALSRLSATARENADLSETDFKQSALHSFSPVEIKPSKRGKSWHWAKGNCTMLKALQKLSWPTGV